MTSRASILLLRANDIIKREGLAPLINRGWDFVRRRVFQYENYYLYEHKLRELDEADFMPAIPDFTLEIVRTAEHADELAKAYDFDIRRRFIDARDRLDKGAVAFCVFVKGESAYIGWVGMTEEAQKSMGQPPYKVDFSNNEACIGGGWTEPKYRGMGIATYVFFKACQFLREQGKIVARDIVATNNVAPQKMLAKFSPRIYGKARHIGILRWNFWRETPTQQTVRGELVEP